MEVSAEQQGEASAKKGPFDGLDRDELIVKLKGLLSVYKNAKQSKEELTTENAQLKETLSALHMQKTADKEHLKGLQTSLQKLNETVAVLEEQKQLDKNYMKGMHEMVEEVTNEKNALSSRVTRLSQENEQLLGDCRKTDSILRQLNDSLGQHQQQVQQLQHMCEQQKIVNTDLRKQHGSEVARNDQLATQLSGLQTKCSAHEHKIKVYHTKLVDFSGQLKELRMCKEVLLTTVREYSQAVSKWQGEILTVSNNFFVKNRVLQDENRLLEERLSSASSGSCGQCAETMQKYEELVVQFEKIVEENTEFGALVKVIEERQQQSDIIDCTNSAPKSLAPGTDNDQELVAYKNALIQLDESLQNVQSEIDRMQNLNSHERMLHEEERSQLEAMISELQEKLENYEEDKALQKQHLETNIETLRLKLVSSEAEITSKTKDNHILQENIATLNSEIASLSDNTDINETVTELQSQVASKDESNKKLEKHVSELQTLLDSIQINLESSQTEVATKEELHQTELKKVAELEAKVGLHEHQFQETKHQFHLQKTELDSKVESLQTQISVNVDTQKSLETKISDLESEITTLRNSLTCTEGEINDKSIVIENLQTETASLRNTLELSQSEIITKTTTHQEALAKLAELESQMNSHQSQAQANEHFLEESKTKHENELKSLRNTITELEAQLGLKDETKQSLESKISEYETQMQTLQIALKSIEVEIKEKDIVIQNLQADHEGEIVSHQNQTQAVLHSKQAELDKELVALQSTLAASQVKIREQTEIHEALQNKNSQLETELQTLRTQLQDHEKSQSQLDCLQNDLTQLQSELNLKEKSNHVMESKVSDLKSELMSLRNNLASQQAQINAKEKSIHTLETTIATKDTTIANNAQQLNDLQALIESVQSELLTSQTEVASHKEALSKKATEQSQNDQTCAKLQEKMKEQHLELSASKMCVDDLRSQLKKAKDNSSVQESTELAALQHKVTELTQTIEALKLETSEAHANLATVKSTFEKTLHESLMAVQKKYDDKSQRFQEQSEAIEQLRIDSAAQMRTLEERVDADRKSSVELQSELKDAERKMTAMQSQFEQLLGDKENVIRNKQMEMDDLLSEMRELNEALRNRGDIISKQEQKIAGLNAELTEKVSHVERLVVEQEQLNEKIREADSMPKMHDLSDQLSTSTVSRIEEIARMRDVDDSFEEKYNKLRSFAVRLKKKINEQTKRIEELEQNPTSSSSTETDTSTLNDAAKLRNLQQLQKQNDSLQDELEALRSTDKRNIEKVEDLSKQLTDVSTELAAVKEANANIKSSVEVNSNQKSSLDQAVKEYVKQIAALKEELTGVKKEKVDINDICQQLKEKLQSQEEELSKVSGELKKVKSSVKKNNVMNLEMEAQEKTLIDISQKLEAKGLKIDELNLTITQHTDTIASLRHQIRLLEETIDSEKEHALELKQQLDFHHTRLRESDHLQSELKIRIDELQQEKTSTNAELIESRLQATQSSEESEKCIALLRSDNERHIQRLLVLDANVSELTQNLRTTEHELQDLKTEFVAYKVRAQSMLRQNQQKESSREVELEDELSTVQSTNETLNTKIKLALEQCQSLEEKLSDQRQECERQQEHSKQLLQLIEETRLNADALQDEVHRQNVDHQQALKAQRLQIDTLNACYKKEIADLVEKHEHDMDAMSQQLLQKQDENRNHNHRTLFGEQAARISSIQRTPPTTDEQRIEWLLTERQDAEGSESNIPHSNVANHQRKQSSSSRGPRDLIPLDELLNNSFDMSTTILSDGGSASPTFDLQATKDRLNVQESRVRHLTTLLAEAEQDTARLTQLNDALKEEVRRQERSAEREKHLHNLEYLKNVMFKFLTINQGDEKAHLVPVLNTMLKLSPEETQKLQMVAKGGDNRGWRGYLPV